MRPELPLLSLNVFRNGWCDLASVCVCSAGPHAAAVATTLFKRSAEQGNVMSLLQLGDCYYYGSGVEQDWVRASAIYYEAYKERSSEAMFNLGFMHEFGAGVPKDMDLALRFYHMAKHTNADAAFPVYLATTWLRAHKTWEWLRPKVPKSIAAPFNWLFEVRPVAGSPAAAAFGAQSSVSSSSSNSRVAGAIDGVQQQGAAGTKAAPALPPAGSPASTAGDASASSSIPSPEGYEEAGGDSSWLWWLSPQVLVWKLDSLMWRLAEAAGIGGSSISALLEEYADTGETVLLIVLFAVLVLVLRIRSQRQQAVENRVRMALAAGAGEDQQLAQQIAAQMGLQIPAGGTAGAAATSPAAGSSAAGAGSSANIADVPPNGGNESAVGSSTQANGTAASTAQSDDGTHQESTAAEQPAAQ